MDWIIHGAAVIGGTWSTASAEEFEAVNQWGAFNVLDAAELHGTARTVLLLSGVVLDSRFTSTERGPFRPISDRTLPTPSRNWPQCTRGWPERLEARS